MTAPTRTRTRTRPRVESEPRTRRRPAATAPVVEPRKRASREAGDGPAPRRRSTAAERAYARRAARVDELARRADPSAESGAQPLRLQLKLRWPRSRASFVLLLMALLAAGVATTLWLSTQAIADSYQLEQLKQTNGDLAERAEHLQREVASAQSPSSLAERARELGMVPGGNPARLVAGDDGKVRVVGKPTKATVPDPPAAPAPAADAEPPADSADSADSADNGGDGDAANADSRDDEGARNAEGAENAGAPADGQQNRQGQQDEQAQAAGEEAAAEPDAGTQR